MVMVKFNKVLVDTSALISICETKVFFGEDVEQELGKVKYYVLSSVIDELNKLSKQNKKIEKCLNNVLKKILKDWIIIEDTHKNADEGIKEKVEMFDAFITNDSELVKFLLKKGKIVFRLSKNKRFVRC